MNTDRHRIQGGKEHWADAVSSNASNFDSPDLTPFVYIRVHLSLTEIGSEENQAEHSEGEEGGEHAEDKAFLFGGGERHVQRPRGWRPVKI